MKILSYPICILIVTITRMIILMSVKRNAVCPIDKYFTDCYLTIYFGRAGYFNILIIYIQSLIGYEYRLMLLNQIPVSAKDSSPSIETLPVISIGSLK